MHCLYLIGIYPEWNVKDDNVVNNEGKITIGIYPEWNVKGYYSMAGEWKPYDWNISRMECKENYNNQIIHH